MPTLDLSRYIVCSRESCRIYAGDRLACQYGGRDAHLCGDFDRLPDPDELARRMADPAGVCPLGKWGELPACPCPPAAPTDAEWRAVWDAFKPRRRERMRRAALRSPRVR